MKKSSVGRPKIGQPLSVTFTDEQRAWLQAQIPPGGTLTQVIRDIVQAAMPKRKGAK